MSARSGRPSGGSRRVGSNELFYFLAGAERDIAPRFEPPDQFGIANGTLAKALGTHARRGKVALNLGEDLGCAFHAHTIGVSAPTRQGVIPPCEEPDPWHSLFYMLRQLLWTALKKKNWSMRRASLEAGLGETYLRDLKDNPDRDPGVGAIMALAAVLDIPRAAVLQAIEDEIGVTQERSQRERALRVLGQMSREELATFLASQKNRPE